MSFEKKQILKAVEDFKDKVVILETTQDDEPLEGTITYDGEDNTITIHSSTVIRSIPCGIITYIGLKV